MQIGFLHPGKMGSAMAAEASGERLWCGTERSAATAERATSAGMNDMGALDALVARSDVIISICPPDAAEDVAKSVAAIGFDGIYCDANAIAPDRARRIGSNFDRFVDGGVVGPPPTVPGAARLYLSGSEAATVAEVWHESNLEPIIVGDGPGAASALKMAYAAWTKGTSALLLGIHALAEAEGVHAPLLAEWDRSQPDLDRRTDRARLGAVPKAWRFAGEMEEIADSFAAAELPDGFHRAAAAIYRDLAAFKDAAETPEMSEILRHLRH